MKTISSAWTFPMKIIFPTVWISCFGAATAGLWLGSTPQGNGAQLPPGMKWQFLFAWVFGTFFILWICAGLKRVRVDFDQLYISNYRKEIAVPLSNVVDVSENRWINIHPVKIHFRLPTEFGQQITFMPTSRFFGFWSSHPVVAELKNLAGIANDR